MPPPPPPPLRPSKASGPPPPPPRLPREQRLAGIFSIPPSAAPAENAPAVSAPAEASSSITAASQVSVAVAAETAAVAPNSASEQPSSETLRAATVEGASEASEASEAANEASGAANEASGAANEASEATEGSDAELAESPGSDSDGEIPTEVSEEELAERIEAASLAARSTPPEKDPETEADLASAEALASHAAAESFPQDPVDAGDSETAEAEGNPTEASEETKPEDAAPALEVAAIVASPASADAPMPPAAPVAPEASPQRTISSLSLPQPTSVSLPPPPPALGFGAQAAAITARMRALVPPAWVDFGRRYPVAWMVGAPVSVALLLIAGIAASTSHDGAETPTRHGVTAAVATPALPVPATQGTAAEQKPADAARTKNLPSREELVALEAKAPDALEVRDLLSLYEARAEQKREQTQGLAKKLEKQPELAKDTGFQTELLGLAQDARSAPDALAVMARMPSPVGADLLFEVWTSGRVSSGVAELARTLLYSHEVRATASPALAAALDLRGATSCEAFQAALPRVRSDGDRRSLSPLAKLSNRRGCGASKKQDCYECLRAHPKELGAVAKAAQARRAPSYPTP